MRCAGTASAALAALALAALLASAEPDPGARCEPDTTDATNATAAIRSCQRLAHQYRHKVASLGVRCVSVRGNAKNVALVWGSDPARAAAALLHAVLRHALRYRRVQLRRRPHRIDELVKEIANVTKIKDPDLVVGVSMAWEVKAAPKWIMGTDNTGGLAGPRLAEFGTSSVAARCRLHARLAPAARARACCGQHTRWTFYANVTALTHCAFVDHALTQTSCEVYSVGCDIALDRLEARANATALPLHVHRVDRHTLVERLRTANHSFLFLDYDIWEGEPNVSIVDPPPCVVVADNSACQQELDPAIAMRVGDVKELQGNAPHLFHFVQQFKTSRKSLRMILEREGNGVQIEEAACEWVLNNSRVIKSWNLNKYDENPYWVKVFYCNDDPDWADIDEVLKTFGPHMKKLTKVANYTISLRRSAINCSDTFDLGIKIAKEAASYESSNGLMGVVAAGAAGAAYGAGVATALGVPLLLVDAAPDAPAVWRVAGRPRHLARALQHFVRASDWTRLAVLSQETTLAAEYNAVLDEDKLLAIHQHKIPLKLTELQAEETLQELLIANARIVFVNADAEAAVVILSAALKLHMSYKDGFVWIVRDWRPNNATSNTTHFTVSFWRRGKEDVPSDTGRPELRNKLSKKLSDRPWPPLTAPLVDALLTLIDGFNNVLREHPASREDLNTADVIRLLNDRLAAKPVTGVTQLLHYKERSNEETLVFVDEWCGDMWNRRLATWRVNASARSDAVRGNYTRPQELPKHDGASRCLIRSGDAFQPTCYDGACGVALLLLILTLSALLLARRHFTYHMQKRQVDIMIRRQHAANVLAGCLVKRDALELCAELGTGCFGSVRLAWLREPARVPRHVAVKALRDNAAPDEEDHFLREACIVASLNHEHVVRLVGVCIADGPPLVLMELAFFGDLLGYLRARRHLVEGGGEEALAACEEAAHVSAEALTRLAREAAAALEYLAKRGVVHRDVRAANCLVDARRSLKLADFGMARTTVAGADGAPEYACRRRGLFPVLWMAPESLAHGVFSAASDVWALGVLVLELVTMGARPYGAMSPLHVLDYVASGGRPPLPLDATPQTRGLARQCWARAAARRPSAAEVRAHLSTWPLALRPALLSTELVDVDSDFGESPSMELLPPDPPLDRLELIVATP